MGNLKNCKALRGGAFDCINCQYIWEFDQNFSKVKCPGDFLGGERVVALGYGFADAIS